MKNVQERFEALKSMNTIIRLMNDENAYSSWIWIVPDGADDNDLMDIAKNHDDIFDDACKKFVTIMEKRLKYGLYIDGKTY